MTFCDIKDLVVVALKDLFCIIKYPVIAILRSSFLHDIKKAYLNVPALKTHLLQHRHEKVHFLLTLKKLIFMTLQRKLFVKLKTTHIYATLKSNLLRH